MKHKPAESSLTSFFAIYAALIFLLLATVGANSLPLGPFSLVVALLIAIAKALLVIIFFMHVRFASKTTWIFVACGFLWLSMLFCMTFSDYLTRNLGDQAQDIAAHASNLPSPPGLPAKPRDEPPPFDFRPSPYQR